MRVNIQIFVYLNFQSNCLNITQYHINHLLIFFTKIKTTPHKTYSKTGAYNPFYVKRVS